MRPFAEVADCICRNRWHAARDADFEASATAQGSRARRPTISPRCASFFAAKTATVMAALLPAIAGDGPGVSEAELRSIAVPTLVIGNRHRPRPSAATCAQTLADAIPNARLVEITPKATDKARHVAEFRAAIVRFLDWTCQQPGPP